MIARVVQIGQSKAVIIPAKVAQSLDIQWGDYISVSFNRKIEED